MKWCDDSEELIENQELIEEALKERHKGTHEQLYVNQEDGCFLMNFSEFLRIFNKLFICIDFPPSYIGFRAHGKWIKNRESGGLPISGTVAEFRSFPNNPQYYLKLNDKKKVFINLLQNDGRINGESFPFSNSNKKICLLVCKTDNEKRINDCNDILDKTSISQRRDIGLDIELDAGEYVIMPCTMKAEFEGEYHLEIFVEDSFKYDYNDNDIEGQIELEHTLFKKLGGDSCKYEIISEGRYNQIHKAEDRKINFMLAQFKNCIADDDDVQYENKPTPEEIEKDYFDNY